MQVRTGTRKQDHAAQQTPAERVPQSLTLPQLAKPCRRAHRVGRHERAIDRAHRGANDHIRPDPGLGQCPKHPDLMSAEQSPATKHKRRLHQLTSYRQAKQTW